MVFFNYIFFFFGKGIQVRPDMDNAYVGNPTQITGLSEVQRYSVAIHWIGAGGFYFLRFLFFSFLAHNFIFILLFAGANYITGSDLTNLDSLGLELLYNEEAMFTADFTSQW